MTSLVTMTPPTRLLTTSSVLCGRGATCRPHLTDPPFIMAFMTLAELRSWMRHRNWGAARRRRLEQYLQ
jgi:hypothetical protein